jgi:mRNA interferase RelE/StbE
MRYTLIIPDEVKEKLRSLPIDIKQEVGYRLFLLEEDLAGDVKKLRGSRNEYRLRIGKYRVIFELECELITVTILAYARISTGERCNAPI